MSDHQHEKWQIQPDADGGTYCGACGESITKSVERALREYRAAVDECRGAEHRKQQAAQALYEARQVAVQTKDQAAWPGVITKGVL